MNNTIETETYAIQRLYRAVVSQTLKDLKDPDFSLDAKQHMETQEFEITCELAGLDATKLRKLIWA